MLLDGKYFNALELELIDDKYYNAQEVDDILYDIRKKAERLEAENYALQTRLTETDLMKERLKVYENQRDEISEAVVTARAAYRTIIERANTKAQQIIEEANEKAQNAAKVSFAIERDEYYVKKVEQIYSKLRESHNTAIDEINDEWQKFLVSLADNESLIDGSESIRESIPEEKEITYTEQKTEPEIRISETVIPKIEEKPAEEPQKEIKEVEEKETKEPDITVESEPKTETKEEPNQKTAQEPIPAAEVKITEEPKPVEEPKQNKVTRPIIDVKPIEPPKPIAEKKAEEGKSRKEIRHTNRTKIVSDAVMEEDKELIDSLESLDLSDDSIDLSEKISRIAREINKL